MALTPLEHFQKNYNPERGGFLNVFVLVLVYSDSVSERSQVSGIGLFCCSLNVFVFVFVFVIHSLALPCIVHKIIFQNHPNWCFVKVYFNC